MSDVQITVSNEGDAQVISASLQETQITSSVPGIQGPVGQGFPSGGTTNQVLFKQSNTSYDAVWGFVTSSMIGDLEIVNADVASGAAIAGTKISPNFGSQNVITTGTNTAASFIPSSSSVPTNGLYLPAANSVALSTNGTGRLFINSAGDIGIGWASPSYDLHLEKDENALTTSYFRNINTGSSAGSRLIAASLVGNLTFAAYSAAHSVWPATTVISSDSGFTGGMAINAAGANPLRLFTDSTERLRITSAGLVGIGTSAPGATLHVEGLGNTVNQRIFTSDNVLNATASLTFGTTPGSRSKAAIRMINVNTGNAQGALSLLTDTGTSGLVDRLYIDGNGRVGIGTTGPNYELHVNASDALSIIQLTNTSTGTAASDGFLIYNNGVNATISNEESGYLRFQTAGLERAQIDSSGRLLVGTSNALTNIYVGAAATTPQIQLSGAGLPESSLSLLRTGATGATIFLNAGSSGNNVIDGSIAGRLVFNGYDGTNYRTSAQITAEVDGTPGVNDMPGRLVFSTTADGASSPTERLRITSAGLVGIGTSLPGSLLHLNSGASDLFVRMEARGANALESSFLFLTKNSAGTNTGGSIGYDGNTNTLYLTGDTSGGATQHLSITNTGRVGIGTTTVNRQLVLNDNTLACLALQNSTTGNATGDGFQIQLSGTDAYIWNYETAPIAFGTNNVERARIDSSGRVGIGTSGPNAPLETAGANGTISIFRTNNATAANNAGGGFDAAASATASSRNAIMWLDADGANFVGSDYFYIQKNGNSGSVQIVQQSNAAMEFHTNGSPRAQIDSSGRFLVGTSNARSNFGGSSALRAQIEGDSFANSGLSITRNSNDNGTPSLCLAKSRSTGNTVVVSNDSLGTVFFEGNDGSNFVRAAQITAQVDGTPGANDMPGRLVFSVTQDGSASPTEALRITNDRYVRLASGTGGIQFNGDTAAANALDDYEEGTWTPALAGATTAGTYETTFASGWYTKIGRQVTVQFRINLAGSITGGGVGFAVITGLPFNTSTDNYANGGSVLLGSVDFNDTAKHLYLYKRSTTSAQLVISEIFDNAAPQDVGIADFAASSIIAGSLVYFIS